MNLRLQKLALSVPEQLRHSIEDCLKYDEPSSIAESFLVGSLKIVSKLKLEKNLLTEVCEQAGECLQILTKTSCFSSALKVNRSCYHFFTGGLGLSISCAHLPTEVSLKATVELLKHFCDFSSLTLSHHDDIQKDFLAEFTSVVDNLSRLSWNLAVTLSKPAEQASELLVLLFLCSFKLRCLSSRTDFRSLLNFFLPICQHYKNNKNIFSVFNEAFDQLVTSCIKYYNYLQKTVPVIDLFLFFTGWVDLSYRQQQEHHLLSSSISYCKRVFLEKLRDHLLDSQKFFKTLWEILIVSTSIPTTSSKNIELTLEDINSWIAVLQTESGSLCNESVLLRIVSFISKWFVTLSNVLRDLPSSSLKLYPRTLSFLPLVQWTMDFLQLKSAEGSVKTKEAPVMLFRGYALCFYYIYKENAEDIPEAVLAEHTIFFRTQLYSDFFLPENRICEVQNILGNIALLLTERGSVQASALLDSLISVIETHARLYGLEKCGIPDPQKTVSKMYGRLALSYRYFGFHSRGLEALAQLLVHVRGCAQEELLRRWLQLKRFIYSSPSHVHIRRRSIVQQLKIMNYSLNNEDACQLLNAELCWYRKNGTGLEEEIFAVTVDIISQTSGEGVNKAMAVIDHCRVARILRWKSKWKLDVLCQQAVDTLEDKSVDPVTFDSPVRQLYISFGCYELYIQKSQQLKDCIRKSGVSRLKTTWVKPIPKGDEEPITSCDIQASLYHVTLASGSECLRPLDKSLLALQHSTRIVEKLSGNWDWAKEAVEPRMLISHAFVLAENFLLAQRMEQSMSSFIQLYHLGASLKDQEIQLQAVCRLTSLLARAGLPSQALLLTRSMQPASAVLKLQCDLSKAEALFYCGEFKEGFDLLINILGSLPTVQDCNYPRSLLKALEVEAHYLLVHFYMLSTPSLCFLSSKENQDIGQQSGKVSMLLQQPPITVALDALKLCVKLYKSQHGSHNFNVSDAGWKASGLKLCLERLLLEGALLVGQIYMHQGEMQEPRHVLLDYLAVAQEQAAMLWSAELLICLAELDLLSHNPDDCSVKCNGLFYLLNNNEVAPITVADESILPSSPEATSHVAEPIDQDCIIFPEIETSHEKDDSLPLFLSPRETSNLKFRCEEIHKQKCGCERCSYGSVDINVLWAKKLQSECIAYSDDPNLCFQKLNLIYNDLHTLTSKSAYKLKRLQGIAKDVAKPLNIKSKEFELAGKQNKNLDVKLLDFILRVKLSMAECLMQLHDPGQALSFLEESLKEIDQYNGLAADLFPSLYASLVFQKCLAKLQIFATEQKQTLISCFRTCHTSESEELQVEISKMFSDIRISEFQETNNCSPSSLHIIHKKNNQLKVPYAPLKKGRGVIMSNAGSDCVSENLQPAGDKSSLPLDSAQTNAQKVSSPVCVDSKVTFKTDKSLNSQVQSITSKMPLTSEKDRALTLTPSACTVSNKLPRRKELVNLSNIKLNSVTECAKTTENSSDAVDRRVLRNRDKPSLSEKFEVLKAARKLRRKQREQKENIESECELEHCTVGNSPETMRSGRRGTKPSRVLQTRRQGSATDCGSEEKQRTTNLLTVTAKSNLKHTTHASDISKEPLTCFPGNCGDILTSVKTDLCDALSAISHHPPSVLYSQLNLLLAMIENTLHSKGNEDSSLQAAYHLSLSVGLTLRHQSLYYLQKRISIVSEMTDYMERLSSLKPSDKARKDVLTFQPWREEFVPEIMKKHLDLIPEDWTVVQVNGARVWHSISSLKANKTPDLMIGRYTSKTPPILALVVPIDSQLRKGFLKEFIDIMETAAINGKEQQPKIWWTRRFNLDKRMENLCTSMETVWLGCWKCLFLGKPTNEEYSKSLQGAVTTFIDKTKQLGLHCENESMLKCLLDGIASLKLEKRQVCSGLLYLFGLPVSKQKPVLNILQSLELDTFPATERNPLILVLDKMVHQLPWENMPFLRNSPVSRMPSLDFLLSQLTYHKEPNTDSVFLNGVNGPNTFYLLNPSKDLLKTEAFFKDKLALIPEWKGLASQVPTKEQVLAAVVDYDCYLYIGHGSGRVYLCKELLQSYPCRAAVILMGCSSAKLKALGCFEPSGVVLQYLMGGCPTVLGNLWDVTDKDIDQFTDILIQKWLRGESGTQINRAVMEGRQVCKLKYLTGAAPIIYGLPVYKC